MLRLRHVLFCPFSRKVRIGPRSRLGTATLVIRHYDETIAWFTGVLGFVLVRYTPLGPSSALQVARGHGNSLSVASKFLSEF